jgi:hypothetical protein
MELHPAENRGYRELYAFARNLAVYWPKLADRMGGSSAVTVLRNGAAAAEELLRDLEGRTPDYGLYGKPAAQSLGANIARARRDVRDASSSATRRCGWRYRICSTSSRCSATSSRSL